MPGPFWEVAWEDPWVIPSYARMSASASLEGDIWIVCVGCLELALDVLDVYIVANGAALDAGLLA